MSSMCLTYSDSGDPFGSWTPFVAAVSGDYTHSLTLAVWIESILMCFVEEAGSSSDGFCIAFSREYLLAPSNWTHAFAYVQFSANHAVRDPGQPIPAVPEPLDLRNQYTTDQGYIQVYAMHGIILNLRCTTDDSGRGTGLNLMYVINVDYDSNGIQFAFGELTISAPYTPPLKQPCAYVTPYDSRVGCIPTTNGQMVSGQPLRIAAVFLNFEEYGIPVIGYAMASWNQTGDGHNRIFAGRFSLTDVFASITSEVSGGYLLLPPGHEGKDQFGQGVTFDCKKTLFVGMLSTNTSFASILSTYQIALITSPDPEPLPFTEVFIMASPPQLTNPAYAPVELTAEYGSVQMRTVFLAAHIDGRAGVWKPRVMDRLYEVYFNGTTSQCGGISQICTSTVSLGTINPCD